MPSVSSSAPPMFRGKQRSPVKPKHGMPPGPGPVAGAGRQQIIRSPNVMRGGPPVDQGYPKAGVSSMVAPPPNGRMMANGGMQPPQGGHRGMMRPPQRMPQQMMADGGFGDPGMMGGPQMGGGPGGQMDSGADKQMQPGGAVPSPQALNYHDEEWECSKCSHFMDGNCEILQIQVNPEGACNAFEAGMSQDETGEQPGEDDGGQGMGTSGMPQP